MCGNGLTGDKEIIHESPNPDNLEGQNWGFESSCINIYKLNKCLNYC